MSGKAAEHKSRSVYDFKNSAFYWIGHATYRFNRELVLAIKPKRMSIAVWRTLAVLAECPGISVKQLAYHAIVERTALAHVLTDMEKKNLIERHSDPRDKRVTFLYLTPLGQAEFSQILPTARRVYDLAMRDIAEDKVKAALDVLRRILANLGESKDEQTPEKADQTDSS